MMTIELNSDLGSCILTTNANAVYLQEGADMHSETYIHAGVFVCQSNIEAQTLINCPLSKAFVMEVSNCLGPRSAYRMQTYYSFDGERIAKSFYDPYAEEGTSWRTYLYTGEKV